MKFQRNNTATFRTETRYDDHGRMECVFVNERAGIADERQDALQSTGFEHGAGFPRADQLHHLHQLNPF